MIDVSIIIVNWNTRQLLLDCIESLIKQTLKYQFEIIVIDNASVDESVSSVKKNYPDVKIVVNDKNEGFARANNIGIRNSRGRYVLLSNTDIKVLDRAVDRMVDYMDSHTDVGSLLPKCIDKNQNLRFCCRELPSLRNLFCEALFLHKIFPKVKKLRGRAYPENYYLHSGSAGTMPCCFMIINRKTIDEIGTLDEKYFFYGEDIEWCKRNHQFGWKVIYFSEATVIHYGGSSTKNASSRFHIEKIKATLRYWRESHSNAEYYISFLINCLHYSIRAIGYLVNGFIHKFKSSNDLTNLKNHMVALWWLISKSQFNKK